jgi:hypothetical protein
MKASQLGSVLVKMLGLWMCVQGIAPFVTGFLQGLLSIPERGRGASDHEWIYAVGSGIYFEVGIVFLLGGRRIARVLFKNDNE